MPRRHRRAWSVPAETAAAQQLVPARGPLAPHALPQPDGQDEESRSRTSPPGARRGLLLHRAQPQPAGRLVAGALRSPAARLGRAEVAPQPLAPLAGPSAFTADDLHFQSSESS